MTHKAEALRQIWLHGETWLPWCACGWNHDRAWFFEDQALEAAQDHVDESEGRQPTLTTIEAIRALSAGSVIELRNGRWAEIDAEQFHDITFEDVSVKFFGHGGFAFIDIDDLPAKLIKRA